MCNRPATPLPVFLVTKILRGSLRHEAALSHIGFADMLPRFAHRTAAGLGSAPRPGLMSPKHLDHPAQHDRIQDVPACMRTERQVVAQSFVNGSHGYG